MLAILFTLFTGALAQTPTPFPGQLIPHPPKCASDEKPLYRYNAGARMFQWVCVKK